MNCKIYSSSESQTTHLRWKYYQIGCIDQARQKIESKIPYLKWAEQIAEGLILIQSKGVVHTGH